MLTECQLRALPQVPEHGGGTWGKLEPQRGHRHDGNATDLEKGGGKGKVPSFSLLPALLPQASISHWPNLARNSLARDPGPCSWWASPQDAEQSRAGKKCI